MNIALIGYGKMGRQIHELARKKGHQVVCIIDEDNRSDIDSDAFREADAAFEFTGPDSAVQNFLNAFNQKVPVISGTTGWLKDWDLVCEACVKSEGGFFYASNFSLGVNLLFNMNRKVAEMMAGFPEYQVHIEEIHHTQKLDAPSGTAISLAEQVMEYNKSFTRWELNPYGKDKYLPIFSKREGRVTGTHTVSYISEIDKISIRHEALSREGFAIGAMMAAEFIKRKTGVFGMNDLLSFK